MVHLVEGFTLTVFFRFKELSTGLNSLIAFAIMMCISYIYEIIEEVTFVLHYFDLYYSGPAIKHEWEVGDALIGDPLSHLIGSMIALAWISRYDIAGPFKIGLGDLDSSRIAISNINVILSVIICLGSNELRLPWVNFDRDETRRRVVRSDWLQLLTSKVIGFIIIYCSNRFIKWPNAAEMRWMIKKMIPFIIIMYIPTFCLWTYPTVCNWTGNLVLLYILILVLIWKRIKF